MTYLMELEDATTLIGLSILELVVLFDFLDDIRYKNSLNPLFFDENSKSDDLPTNVGKKTKVSSIYVYVVYIRKTFTWTWNVLNLHGQLPPTASPFTFACYIAVLSVTTHFAPPAFYQIYFRPLQVNWHETRPYAGAAAAAAFAVTAAYPTKCIVSHVLMVAAGTLLPPLCTRQWETAYHRWDVATQTGSYVVSVANTMFVTMVQRTSKLLNSNYTFL